MKNYYNGPLNNERSNFLSLINFNKSISSAKGSYLYSDEGETYLDFTSQYGAVSFGHNPDFLWEEINKQSISSQGIMIQPFQSQGAIELAEELIKLSPGNMKHVTFGCTGAEGVEISIKIAKSKTKRSKILSATNSFHGKTMGAVLATGNQFYSEIFYSDNDAFVHVPFNDLVELEKVLSTEEFAAFIVEPIQGEGGMVESLPGYLNGCQTLCEKFGTLFVIDEIQTGLGRTGSLFACEKEDVQPDILILAKALGGGLLPLSACLSNEKSWSPDFCERHSSTFANNHLSAMVGLQVIRRLSSDKKILDNIKIVGNYLKESLIALVNDYPLIYKSTSGCGLMQGIALESWQGLDSYIACVVSESGYVVPVISSYLLNEHKIFTAPTLNASDVLRIQPNYTVTKDQVDQLIYGLRDIGYLVSNNHFEKIFRSVIGLNKQNSIENEYIYKNTSPTPYGPKLGTFAFLMHPTTNDDLVESMPGGSMAYSQDDIDHIIEWGNKLKSVNFLATAAHYIPSVQSSKYGYVDGWFISCPLLPNEMMHLTRVQKEKLLSSYVAVAKQKNANVIGLGAFTSVISKSGTAILDCGIPVTTGNSYTALTSTDSIRYICKKQNRNIDKLHFGVVGVSGSVGRLAMLDLGPECNRVSLMGNPKNKANVSSLEVIAGELLVEIFFSGDKSSPIRIKLESGGVNVEFIRNLFVNKNNETLREIFCKVKGKYISNKGSLENFPIELSNNVSFQLPKCDLVISATSNGKSFITPNMIAENAIMCDVARPSDLIDDISIVRNDVTFYEGGLVNLPNNVKFGEANLVGLPTGVTLACLSEAMILTMKQATHNYSIGGTSSLEEAKQIFQWGKDNGFITHIPKHVHSDVEVFQSYEKSIKKIELCE